MEHYIVVVESLANGVTLIGGGPLDYCKVIAKAVVSPKRRGRDREEYRSARIYKYVGGYEVEYPTPPEPTIRWEE
jgi:hypothetical protein